MKFSRRTFLVVISVVSAWLGALVSKSPLLVELAAGGTVCLILLSLALAIWEPRPLQRAFWTGFFALAFGNLVYNGFFNSYLQTSNQVAQLILGASPPSGYIPPVVPAGSYNALPRSSSWTAPPSITSFYALERPSGDDPSADEVPRLESPLDEDLNGNPPQATLLTPPTTGPVPTLPPRTMPSVYFPAPAPYAVTSYGANYYEQQAAIRASVPSLISLLMGVVGGCVTMWIAAKRQEEVSAKAV